MPKVVFTANLQRHVSCPPQDTAGATVGAALEEVFAENPRLRGYILDDQGRVRHHVVVFVDGQRIQDPVLLSDPVKASSEIFVMQALSGG
jgi:molybdopterin converting factor small subunit